MFLTQATERIRQQYRYQRLLREIARHLPVALTEKYDMVWIAKPGIIKVKTLQELQHSLENHLDTFLSNVKRKT